jgi:hypothetical protein
MSNRRRKGDLISRLLSNRDKLRNNNRELSKKYSILKSRTDKAIGCIEKFLCTEEYIKVDGEAIANNYQEVLEKLKGSEK